MNLKFSVFSQLYFHEGLKLTDNSLLSNGNISFKVFTKAQSSVKFVKFLYPLKISFVCFIFRLSATIGNVH